MTSEQAIEIAERAEVYAVKAAAAMNAVKGLVITGEQLVQLMQFLDDWDYIRWLDEQHQMKTDTAKANEIIQSRVPIPISLRDLRDLFDYLDEASLHCDHTHRETIEFLEKRGLDARRVVEWLCGHGGNCDCKAMADVARPLGYTHILAADVLW
jgi:hypothetical protein